MPFRFTPNMRLQQHELGEGFPRFWRAPTSRVVLGDATVDSRSALLYLRAGRRE
jgi:hypothetical protein